MSAIRIGAPGIPVVLVVQDDGCSPHRSSRGIRGGIGNPVIFGALAVGDSAKTIANRQTREYKARKTAERSQRTDYGWGIYAPEEP